MFQQLPTRQITVLLVAVILLTHVPAIAQPFLNIDEADFAVQTAVWMDGGTPYVDFVEKKPPLIHAAYAVAFAFGGTWNMIAVHLLFALVAAGTGLLLAGAARQIAGTKAGVVALALFAVYQAGYDLNDFLAANTETLMNLGAALAALTAIAALTRKRRRLPWLFVAGIGIGISTLAKPVGIVFLPALFLALAWEARRPGRRTGAAIGTLVATAGLALPLAATALWLHSLGALNDAIRWVWTENVRYGTAGLPLALVVRHGAVRLGLYIAVSLVLWLLSGAHLVHLVRRRALASTDVLLFAWLALSLVAVSLGGRFFPHYFLQLVPPLAVLAALGWASVWQPIAVRHHRLDAAAAILFLAAPLIAFAWLHVWEVQRLPIKRHVERDVAASAAALTKPGDRLFVWGHNSDIYGYAKRLPATRFVYCSYLTGSVEGFEGESFFRPPSPGAEAMLLADLRRHPPAAIVDMSPTDIRGYRRFPLDAQPALDAFVREGYAIERIVDGAIIWVRHPAEEPESVPIEIRIAPGA